MSRDSILTSSDGLGGLGATTGSKGLLNTKYQLNTDRSHGSVQKGHRLINIKNSLHKKITEGLKGKVQKKMSFVQFSFCGCKKCLRVPADRGTGKKSWQKAREVRLWKQA